jgi:NTE family protein
MADPEQPEDKGLWRELGERERLEVRSAMQPRRVARGEILIEQGASAESLFIVNFGLFEVKDAGGGETVDEIGAGQLIGEIGFFAGGRRNASVVAARDSEVLEIGKAEFDELANRLPAIQRAVTRSLARRLAQVTYRARSQRIARPFDPARAVVVVGAGSAGVPDSFVEALRAAATARAGIIILTHADAAEHFADSDSDRYAIANWLARIEPNYDLVVCIADKALTAWTQSAVRSADQLLLVAGGSPDSQNDVESFALELFPSARRQLVRLHARRAGAVEATSQWLRLRDAAMTHHLAIDDGEDFHRLVRFLTGEAIGFVAGGGGAFGPAHAGIFKAFRESGIVFDIFGGSSIGAAMTAAFSLLMSPEEIDSKTHDIFIRRRALKRWTLPRYGFLDHTALDEALRQSYGEGLIQDAWKPFFAVTADLSTYSLHVMRTGPLWQAVRASCSIPGVLPPFFDGAGHMLVDGGVADNVPVEVMRSLKAGPNVVVELRPRNHRVFDVRYESIPGRWELMTRLINPLSRRDALPRCPSPASVIQASLFGNLRGGALANHASDLTLRPPPFPGSSFMDWSRHREVFASAYQWGVKMIEGLKADNDPAYSNLERLSRAR